MLHTIMLKNILNEKCSILFPLFIGEKKYILHLLIVWFLLGKHNKHTEKRSANAN